MEIRCIEDEIICSTGAIAPHHMSSDLKMQGCQEEDFQEAPYSNNIV